MQHARYIDHIYGLTNSRIFFIYCMACPYPILEEREREIAWEGSATTATKKIFPNGPSRFSHAVARPTCEKRSAKIAISHAASVTAYKKVIFAYGPLSQPHKKIFFGQKKIQQKTLAVPPHCGCTLSPPSLPRVGVADLSADRLHPPPPLATITSSHRRCPLLPASTTSHLANGSTRIRARDSHHRRIRVGDGRRCTPSAPPSCSSLLRRRPQSLAPPLLPKVEDGGSTTTNAPRRRHHHRSCWRPPNHRRPSSVATATGRRGCRARRRRPSPPLPPRLPAAVTAPAAARPTTIRPSRAPSSPPVAEREEGRGGGRERTDKWWRGKRRSGGDRKE